MTPQSERFISLDVLRGLGILGILAVNAPFFAMPFAVQLEPEALGQVEGDSLTAWAVVKTFFERKFVTLFSMLFGASILLVGGEKGDPVKSPHIHRRLGWLFLFGLLHGALVWYGDILLAYAVAGFIAAQFRSWSPRRLFVVGVLLYLFFAAIESLNYWVLVWMPQEAAQGMAFASPEAAREAVRAFSGDFASSLQANVETWGMLVGFMVFFIPSTIGLMLIGMGLFKTGVFLARRGAGFYLLGMVVGGAALAAIGWSVCQEVRAGLEEPVDRAVHSTLNAFLAPLVTLGYVSALCLLVKSPVRGLLGPLRAAGQMAFTNYLTQSLIMTAIFYGGRGPGLFGTMTLAELVPVVAGVWLLQLVWSPIWLTFFHYGPFEWVWRCLTYKQLAPFVRRRSALAA